MKGRMGFKSKDENTSWEEVGDWYDKAVGASGSYYHQQVVIPGTLRLLNLEEDSAVLDLGCGQGVLARYLPKKVGYEGIDASEFLIRKAREYDRSPNHTYKVGAITKSLETLRKDFSHAAIILALQNIENPAKAIGNAARHLGDGGKLVIVMNHPCFRIPRQSGWGIDERNKLQYRRINKYLSAMRVPIAANPSQGGKSAVTWSFHWPLSEYFKWLKTSGLVVEQLEEWSSDKQSMGKAAKMENRSRVEIPLFLAIQARKISIE